MLEVPAAVAIRYPGVEGLEDTCRHLIIDAMKHSPLRGADPAPLGVPSRLSRLVARG